MVAPHPPPGAPVSPASYTSFLPLTLSTIRDRPGLGPLGDHAVAAELAAGHSWQALLGDCVYARRFPDTLRQLSEAAGEYAGGDWWVGRGSTHRARIRAFERWVADALAESDGAEFAQACARYDAALAHALLTAPGHG
jgi:hypothetical protein